MQCKLNFENFKSFRRCEHPLEFGIFITKFVRVRGFEYQIFRKILITVFKEQNLRLNMATIMSRNIWYSKPINSLIRVASVVSFLFRNSEFIPEILN